MLPDDGGDLGSGAGCAGAMSGPAFAAVSSGRLHGIRPALQHLPPADYLTQVTPKLLLHRRERRQDLAAFTPAAIAAEGKVGRKS